MITDLRHIEVRRRDKRWVVLLVPRSEEQSVVLVAYRTKKPALIAARAVGLFARTEVKWTDRKGRYIDSNSYGGDRPDRKG